MLCSAASGHRCLPPWRSVWSCCTTLSNPSNCCAQHPIETLLLQAFAAGYAALLAIFILLFRVSILWIVLYAILSFPIGLGYSWLLTSARRTRQQTAAQVGHLPAFPSLADEPLSD